MLASRVLQAARERLRPSRWGALPLFLGLLVALRLSLGAPWVMFQPRLLLFAGPVLAGTYLLAPMAWQWTGAARPRPWSGIPFG